MPILNREFIRFNDNLYEVIKRYSENRVKPDKIDELRQIFYCDATLKKDGSLFFCKIIQEAELVN